MGEQMHLDCTLSVSERGNKQHSEWGLGFLGYIVLTEGGMDEERGMQVFFFISTFSV